MVKRFNDFTNESIKDKMVGKQTIEVLDAIEKKIKNDKSDGSEVDFETLVNMLYDVLYKNVDESNKKEVMEYNKKIINFLMDKEFIDFNDILEKTFESYLSQPSWYNFLSLILVDLIKKIETNTF
jgi:hypothetical protein